MSFLFGGLRSAFDELVDNATSELLPAGSEDLALNFDICDQIRGKQVPPKDAMRSLKRRVLHKNPNVQILALKLTDTCVKNGGRHFVQEIASSEFLDAVVDQLRVPALSHQVRVLILQYLQSWALACRGKPDLDLIYSTYSRLKAEGGWTFPTLPAEDRLGGQAIMIDTNAPPEWTDSPHCERCRTVFTFTNRKHHCRACGKTFCGDCSAKSIALTHLGIPQPVRVCDGCYGRGGKPAGASSGTTGTSTPPSLSRTSSRVDPPATAVTDAVGRKEQEELDLAIALSLAESDQRGRPSSNYQPPVQLQQRQEQQASKAAKRVTFTDHGTSDEDDPDLARALAASLAELNMRDTPFSQPSSQRNDVSAARPTSWGSSTSYTDSAPPAAATTAPAATVSPPTATANPSFVLTDVELDNIALFAAMMQQIDEQGRADAILGSREHAVLQQAMRDLHPRLLAWLHDTMATHKQLAELHTKVTDAMRRYEDAIDQQLRGPVGMPAVPAQVHATGMHPPYYAPPPQQQQEMPYPPPPPHGTMGPPPSSNGYAMPPPPMGPPGVGPYAPPAAMGMPDPNAAAPTPPPGYGPQGTLERSEPPNMYAPPPPAGPNYAYGPPPPAEYHAPPPQGGYPGPAVMGPPPGFGAPAGPVGSAPMAPPSGPPTMVGPPSGYAGQHAPASAAPAEVAPLIEL
ncbi:Vacuolar protein-sorting-associated protein 27 [Allomyces arbusculus]|nr:Vacuolar protein-sorting-associated protein 27 [Allomyces arbusculus]